MQGFEYKVVPAPERAEKIKGARSPEARFAQTLEALMNRFGRDGWEYVRADTLPVQERLSLTRKGTVYRTVLVFRRAVEAELPIEPAFLRPLEVSAAEGKAPPLRAVPEVAPPFRARPQEAAPAETAARQSGQEPAGHGEPEEAGR